jgi:hypothetical protein
MKRFVRRALIVVAAIVGIVFAQVPAASAQEPDLSGMLANLWTQVLQTPLSESPVGTDHSCWNLGDNTVAPFFGPPPDSGLTLSCTVDTDTKLFVVGWSTECSTFDNDCGRQSDPSGPCGGSSLGQLLACAVKMDKPHRTPTITIDGKSVKVTQVTTTMPNLELKADNIFEDPDAAGTGQSAAHGWVALVGPLPVGSHEIVITDPTGTTPTTIVVNPAQ